MNAVDTNVFVYLVDVDEPAKRARANELMDQLAVQEDSTVLLWQVAVEFLACLRRWESLGKVTRPQRLRYWHQVAAMFDIIPPTVMSWSGAVWARAW